MGYYVIFRKLYGGFAIYHDLVKEYRKSLKESNLDENYWKEREERGLNANLQWICDAMERRRFDLIFLTERYAIFKRRNWLQDLAVKLGL